MSIDNISEGFGPQLIQRGYLDSKKRVGRSDEVQKKAKPDQVNISSDAKKLMQRDALVEQVKTALDNLPEIREERVQQAENRLAYGHYADESVSQKVVGSLFEEQTELPGAVQNSGETDVPPQVDMQMQIDKLKEVEQRVVDGYYDRLEVIESLVEKLMG